MTNSQFNHPLVLLTRLWLAIYTSGMSAEAKLDRRAEVESDIWEQLSDAGASSRSPFHVAIRCILGMPADLVWRLDHSRIAKEGPRMSALNTSSNRAVFLYAGVALIAFASAMTIVVVDNLQYARGREYIVPSGVLVTSSFILLALSLTGIATGFLVMHRSPDLGAALAIGGALTGGLLYYWLIIPPLLGLSIALYAFSRARRLRSSFKH